MLSDTPGIHHVTAIGGDAQDCVDFYAGVLGLRLVKRTVNFEEILQYHLYFGNRTGDPGTVFTLFPDPHGDPGRVGKPQLSDVAFAVPGDAIGYWSDRLAERDVAVEREADRFGETVLRFSDPAGTRLELVGIGSDDAGAFGSGGGPWTGGGVPTETAIRGIRGVSALSVNPYATAGLLETLGFERVGQRGDRIRYGVGESVVDLLDRESGYGREGRGTHHHVAVRVGSEDELHDWRELFADRGYDVSRVKDRHVFHSLYVREPGGILFELATEAPGLSGVEPVDDLGESLWLPDWFEDDRDLIEGQLPPLELSFRGTTDE